MVKFDVLFRFEYCSDSEEPQLEVVMSPAIMVSFGQRKNLTKSDQCFGSAHIRVWVRIRIHLSVGADPQTL